MLRRSGSAPGRTTFTSILPWSFGRHPTSFAALLLCLFGCVNGDMPTTEAGVEKWSKDCADRLIVEARKWYDGIEPDLSDARFAFDVQAFLATAGSIKTYRLVMDAQGIPVDVTWDNDFWDAAASAMPKQAMKDWKIYSVSVLDAVRIATGISPPVAWSDPAAMPVLTTVAASSGVPPEAAMASLERLIPLPERNPVTLELRTIMPRFPDAATFPPPPQTRSSSPNSSIAASPGAVTHRGS